MYRPQNILITGCAGCIGSHVAEAMVQRYPEYYFVGVDILDYCASLLNMETFVDAPNFCFVEADILDGDQMQKLFVTHNIDTVMHFAAQSHVDNSFGNSLEFTRVNVLGTHTLLEVARNHKVSRFLHVSTDEVYGTTDSPSDESMMLAPTNPYAASKSAAEQLVTAYYRSFGLPIIITRSNNVYGPRQFPEKMIPKFIFRLLRGEKCCIHGSGEQTRSMLYASDACEAFDLLLHKGKVGHTYNIGAPCECSVLQMARILVDHIKHGPLEDHLEFVQDRPFNDQRYWITTTKLDALGWQPQVSLEEGIQKTIQWYTDDNVCRVAERWPKYANYLSAHPTIQ